MSNWKIAEELDAESAIGVLRDDVKWLKRYIRQCTVLGPLVARLAEPLETPMLATYANRIEQRINDMTTLMQWAGSAVPMLDDFAQEFELRIAHWVRSGWTFSGPEFVYQLNGSTTYIAAAQKAERIEELRAQVMHEDDHGHIDWLLEDYVGSEARVFKRIERLQPGDPSLDAGELQLDLAIYGVLKYHSDPDYIAERIEEARAE